MVATCIYVHVDHACARRILDTSALLLHVKLECVARSSVSEKSVHSTFAHIVFSKAALQKRGSMEPMEPPLDPPLCKIKGRRSIKAFGIYKDHLSARAFTFQSRRELLV